PLIGVEDDGRVSGLERPAKTAEEWVVNVCRNNVQPPLIPFWQVANLGDGRTVGIVTIPDDCPDKPYRARRGTAWVTYIRVGSTSREATREEEARLFQSAGLVRYDLRPVPGATLADLDLRRLTNYFRDVLGQDCPGLDDVDGWTALLQNVDMLTESQGRAIPTVAGTLLFGRRPHRFLPQSGITATAYPDAEKTYATIDEEVIKGPLVRLGTPGNRPEAGEVGATVETGVIDRAVEFVRRNLRSAARLDGAVRTTARDLPDDAVREAIVNAVAHRDYTLAQTDIEVSLFSDRLEIVSPGRLPNSVTVEKMRRGYRAARNELLKEVLRDYGYVEHRGMGVRTRIIAGMLRHNGTEPDLIEDEDRFTVRLFRALPSAMSGPDARGVVE
ncbi:MAG: ATP-dependent DNA helicase RecG, partial [Armatimonadetes bacterium]|nr:ATP-dependent DNA helicase RecG [Armatimonadota bacterium]